MLKFLIDAYVWFKSSLIPCQSFYQFSIKKIQSFLSVFLSKYLNPKAGPTTICECIETDVACLSNGAQLVFDDSGGIGISREFLCKKENVKFVESVDKKKKKTNGN